MRLIDADLLKQNCKITGEFQNNFQCVSLTTLGEVIDNQPTAYDVEKVVERLEEYRDDFMDDIYEELRDDPDNFRANRIIDRFDETIEIVRKGGIE